MQATSAPTQATSADPAASGLDRDALTRDLYALASYMMREATARTLNTIAELEISFTQLKALCALENDGEERSVKALAGSMNVSLPAMSRAVDGLYERGFVEREEDRADRRMKRVRLTAAGHRVPRALNEARLVALSDLVRSLEPAEARALERALARIVGRREEIAAHRPANANGGSQ